MAERFHPILRTSRSEIAETCRSPEYSIALDGDGELLAQTVEQSSEETIAQIALKAGDLLMEDGDYWMALPLAAESVLGVQLVTPD